MAEKTRYSDEELEEFRQIILEKMELARRDYQQMMDTLTGRSGNDVDDTMPTYKVLEEGSMTQTKEELTTMAARQQKDINKKNEQKIKELQAFIQRFSANASRSSSRACRPPFAVSKTKPTACAASRANSYRKNAFVPCPMPPSASKPSSPRTARAKTARPPERVGHRLQVMGL